MTQTPEWETVIGLEIHVELATETKLFCACPNRFGAEPNTLCCPVCLGLPGALPVLNRHAVGLALRAAAALHGTIAPISRWDRKHYSYPDLPKGYQTTQDREPFCRGGWLEIPTGTGSRRIAIERIHLEEDAGKLLHGAAETLVDCNRCGVPLIEIVTAPELRTGADAAAFLRELRAVLVACGVSDCRMQEGSMRCDVNLSLRLRGAVAAGTRTEVKNLNSFAYTEKAIAAETRRQIAELAETGRVRRCTLRYDAAADRTLCMRGKESAAEYRFLPEPDLPPLCIPAGLPERIAASLPELPRELRARLSRQYGLQETDAAVLASVPGLAAWFEDAAGQTRYPLAAAGLLLNEGMRYVAQEPFSLPFSPVRFAELAELMGDRRITAGTAKALLARLAASEDFSPAETAEAEHLLRLCDPVLLGQLAVETVRENGKVVEDLRAGKRNARNALFGRLLAKSGGRADPTLASQALDAALQEEL